MTIDDIKDDVPELLRKLKELHPRLRYTQILSMVVGTHCLWYKNPDIYYIDDNSLRHALIWELYPELDKVVKC